MVSYCMLCTTGSWKFPAAVGIIGVLIGGIFLLFPSLSLTLAIYLFAVIALLSGIALLAGAAFLARGGSGVCSVPLVLGVIAVILAVYSFLSPEKVAGLFAIVIGLACLLAGMVSALTALSQPAPVARKALVAGGGVLLAGLGIFFLVSLGQSMILVFQVLGGFLVIAGAVALAGAVILWRRGRSCEPGVIDAEYRIE